MSLEPGQVLDSKYRVIRLIGEGGMGTVYEGVHSRIGRRVAIKVLHVHVAAMPEFVERFEREARASARIGSPHVCDVLDLGDLPGGDRYIVMEFLDGTSLEDRLEQLGRMTPAHLAPIAFELLEGLATMHDARVVHRDLKPANVFLSRTPSGRGEVVKILDFGVAKLQPFEGEVGTMTQTGMMMGTPLFMSPEQARGARDVDGRTDIYAASVMFYRALTGVLPYTADTLNELLFKIVLEDPKPLRELAPEVDEVFAEIVHKGLARDVEQRFQTARAFQVAIAAWGKKQGRASLAFAHTITSDPPPAFARRASDPAIGGAESGGSRGEGGGPRPVTGPHSGTPIAWSEDGPQVARAAGFSAPAASGSSAASERNLPVRPAAGAPSDGPSANRTVVSAPGPGAGARDSTGAVAAFAAASSPADPAAGGVAASGAAKSSAPGSTGPVFPGSAPPPNGPWAEARPGAGFPAGHPGSAGGPPGQGRFEGAAGAVTQGSAPRRSRGPLAIGLGVAGVIAASAIFVLTRGTPAASGLATAPVEATAPAGERTPASAALPPSGSGPLPMLGDKDAAAAAVGPAGAVDAGVALDVAPAVPVRATTSPATAPRHEAAGALAAKKTDPLKPAAPPPSSTPSAAPALATTAPPPARPAASASRKFRTNLD